MCGVFGLIYPSSDLESELSSAQIINDALKNIRFRGPDGSGISRNKLDKYNIDLAHSRLAIVDLSEFGSQPMGYKNFEITYNGEIYNFIEIKRELEVLGYVFDGNSDTEVVIKSWHAWGKECLKKFNGMFAFALLDKKSNRVWLVRDRFGVKPLFYGRSSKDKLILSSSAAFIGDLLKSKVNLKYCARAIRYKVFETDGCESPLQDVLSVKPGSVVEIDLSSDTLTLSENVWYDLAAAVEIKRIAIANKSFSDVHEECLSIFQDAVKIRLRTDVPLAVSLSGGLDSSSIASMSSNEINHLEGFTFGHPDNISSEGPTVSRFCQHTGIKANYIWPNYDGPKLEKMLHRVLSAQEAPFGGLSVMAQYEVYKAVNERGFKVLLGGQGGDEAFAGYRKFFITAIREALQENKLNDSLDFFYSLLRVLLSEISFMGTYINALKRYTNSDDKNSLLEFTSEKINLWGENKANLSSRQIEDFNKFSIPTLLRFEDRNSMANSVESRLPFMDYRLIEFGLALPANAKIKFGYGKWILRSVMKNFVPDFIRLERKKRGFDVTKNWINEGLGIAIRDQILSKKDVLEEYIKPNIILEDKLSNEALESNRLLLDEALMLVWLSNPYVRN